MTYSPFVENMANLLSLTDFKGAQLRHNSHNTIKKIRPPCSPH